MKYKDLASDILKKVGGEENVSSVTHCATRLRFNLKDDQKADTEALKNTKGIVGVVNKGGQYQVVVGNEVNEVYRELVEVGNLGDIDTNGNEPETESDKGVISKVLDTIAGTFSPIIPVLAGAGMLKALLAIIDVFGWATPESQTYQFLEFMGDAGFYFLPVVLAASAAKKFRVNQYIAMVIGAILLHPTYVSMMEAAKETGEGLSFIGIPVSLVTYSSSVIPILLAIWFMSYVEPFVNKIVPKATRIILAPVLIILIVSSVTFIAIGPLGNFLGLGLGALVTFLNTHVSWLVPTIVGAFTPILVMAGMHYGLIPIGISMLASDGYDTVAGPGMMLSNIAQGGAAFAVALRARNKELKSLAATSGFTAVLGITEPALYGINLRYRRPLIAAMIGGAVGGLFIGIFGVGRYAQVPPGLLALPAYVGPDGFSILIYAIIGIIISFIVSFAVSYVLGIKEEPIEETVKETKENKQEETEENTVLANDVLYTPIKGEAVELADVNDDVFSQGILGKGVAIIPAEGKVYAPVDGEVTALFDTHHAIGLTGENGSEILIHIGIDTVQLEGKHYTPKVAKDQTVKKGELLIEFDVEAIKEAGYDVITPIIVTNSMEYTDVLGNTGKNVEVGEALIKVIK